MLNPAVARTGHQLCEDPAKVIQAVRPPKAENATQVNSTHVTIDLNKKLSCCWETVRRESMPRIAEMDVEMTT